MPGVRYDVLKAIYAAKPLRLVLLEVLGLLATPLCAKDSPALPLVAQCVVVTIDTEAWTDNTDDMTEIGVVVAEYKDGAMLNGNLGDFAENVLRKMKYYHLRIWENAHFKTTAEWMRGAEGNRFGQSRFVTFVEARQVLDEILKQPIISNDPELAGLKRPVILGNIQTGGLNYNFKKHGTVVKEIDTQTLVKDMNAWKDPAYLNHKIGLDVLCEAVFDFSHEDPHTALNDAARTIMCPSYQEKLGKIMP